MYTTEELIDHIRVLESEKSVDTVYTIVVAGSNSCGEPFAYIVDTYQNLDNVPPASTIMSSLANTQYEEYEEGRDSCCGEDPECCGSTPSKSDWSDSNLSVSVSSYYSTGISNMSDPNRKKFGVYVGTLHNNYDETTMEVMLHKEPIKDA